MADQNLSKAAQKGAPDARSSRELEAGAAPLGFDNSRLIERRHSGWVWVAAILGFIVVAILFGAVLNALK